MFRGTGNLVLTEEGLRELNRVLGKLVTDAGARAVLLLEKSGQLLAAQGETAGLDTMSLAALLVGAFGSNRAIAGIFGESEFRLLYQQGQQQSLYIQAVGPQALLAVIFPSNVPIGKVKFNVEQLGGLLDSVFAGMQQPGAAPPKPAAPAVPPIKDLF